MFFGDGYFGLNGDLGCFGRDGCRLFDGWLKKRSGRRWSEETSGRDGLDGWNNWRRGSLLGARNLSIWR